MRDAGPLRILQVVSSPWLTGPGSAALELACSLRELGHRVRLAAIPGGLLEARAREAGLSFEGFRFDRRLGPLDAWSHRGRLLRLVREAGIQVVHAHLSHDHWIALSARRGAGLPLVVRTFHLPRAVKGDALHRLLCYRRTDGFLAVSEGVRARCVRAAGIPEDRVQTLRGMVDTDFFRPGTGAESPAALGLDGEGPVVGTVSRLSAARGHLTLLEAFARVRAQIPAARLLIAGKGERRAEILRRAEALGLGRAVVLPGFWEGDLRDVFRQLRVFVLQSAGSEGTGRALLEAMACGLPCVVTASDGLDEIVGGGDAGVVVPPADPDALAEAVLRLLRDPDSAAALGRRARSRAEAEFRRDLQAVRTAAFYRSVLGRKDGETSRPRGFPPAPSGTGF